jgi:16S rRNA A1518/A1519 N6-dimethyltransferase RsmA/KsgA/DIM1 with predicted DNA glycosylase/AP lyase activity
MVSGLQKQQVERDWLLQLAILLGTNQVVPFVPVRYKVIPVILDALNLGSDDVFYDLGCGDGRVAVYAAKHYNVRKSVCIEIDRRLAEQALVNAIKEGVGDRVMVLNADFREIYIGDATAVYMYLLSSVNEALKPKLEGELSEGTRIATLDFPILGWKPYKVIGHGGWQKTIYVYVIGRHKE